MCCKILFNIVFHYVRSVSGAIAILFALMAPVVVGAAGMALDFSQAYLVQQRLAQALDAAALAGAASSTDATVIEQKIKQFFEINYPPEKIGATIEPHVVIDGDEVYVSGNAYYNTWFLRVIGIDEIDLVAETVVQREVQGIEVVLVMDNTGSMSTNNNIQSLRTAARNFVYILYGIPVPDGTDYDPAQLDSHITRDKRYIKIGLVPYSTSVNVGPYGLGQDPNGNSYGSPFVNNPLGLSYTTNAGSSNWLGCVLANNYNTDTTDNAGPWDMYRYCRDDQDRAVCDTDWRGRPRRGPNNICPRTPLMPLTNNVEGLWRSIDSMNADGYTLGNIGMVWGYRVLSEDFPFTEGSSWHNEYWRKVIVMMTDGVNTMHQYYTAYGPTQDHNLRPSDLNERFAEVCEHAKADGAIIYTITFAGGVDEDTKDYYRDCATNEDQYHHAPSQEDLVEVFEQISRELSQLHIKQ